MDDEVRYISGPLLQQLDQDLQECESKLLCFTASADTEFITGPPVLFCSLASVVCRHLSSLYVMLPAAGRMGNRPLPGRAVGRLTLNGGPVRLRPVRATPC